MKALVMSASDAAVDYECEDVVIGADLNAVEFAHENGFVLIKNREPHHHSYEGVEDVWAEKIYDLYNNGLVPFTDASTNIRIDDEEKIVKVYTTRSLYTVRYQNVHVFDTKNVEGVEINRKLAYYRVIDWFDCRGLTGLDVDEIVTDDDLVHKIKFFPTRRVDGDQKFMDLLCESRLTDKQLKSFECGDTMVRFKTTDLLKARGLENVKMTFWKRDVYPTYKVEDN